MRPLGSLESRVMEVLWDASEPMTVRAVLERLAEPRPAYTTVMTVMDNLFRKGMLSRAQRGRAYAYSPLLDQPAYAAELLADVLEHCGDRAATLLRFLSRRPRDEVDELRALLDRIVAEERDDVGVHKAT